MLDVITKQLPVVSSVYGFTTTAIDVYNSTSVTWIPSSD